MPVMEFLYSIRDLVAEALHSVKDAVTEVIHSVNFLKDIQPVVDIVNACIFLLALAALLTTLFSVQDRKAAR
jgi:hypothetical protein